MMWETNGHSDGKKVPEVSSPIACHISESYKLYCYCAMLSPYNCYLWLGYFNC